MTPVVVGGALANKAGSGGEAWVRMSWVRGLQRLGLDVWFVEEVARAAGAGYFRTVVGQFGLEDRATLLHGDDALAGPSLEDLLAIAPSAVLVNISGHLTHPRLFPRFRSRVLVDIDPGFTQAWYAAGNAGARVEGHDLHFTIAERIGEPDCAIPTAGIHWRTVRQPVVLDDWPVTPVGDPGRFTTVGTWRGPFGPLELDGRTYGLKVHQFRRFIELPRHSSHRFELALDIHPGDAADRAALVEHGWRLVDPKPAAADPLDFRSYVQGSGAEFSVAQGVYVDTRSGWFSDRTVRYLASGRPALVQETGFSETLRAGMGLVGFSTLAGAVAGAADIVDRYDAHAGAARELARRCFGSDMVLGRFCDEAGIVG